MCICTNTRYGEDKIPRCRKNRHCRFLSSEKMFKPIGIPMSTLEQIEINLDEFESMRLCDYENLNQIEAASKMGISRGTIQRLLTSGRKKLIEALLNSKGITIKNKQW